jgi:hypothetical protein
LRGDQQDDPGHITPSTLKMHYAANAGYVQKGVGNPQVLTISAYPNNPLFQAKNRGAHLIRWDWR